MDRPVSSAHHRFPPAFLTSSSVFRVSIRRPSSTSSMLAYGAAVGRAVRRSARARAAVEERRARARRGAHLDVVEERVLRLELLVDVQAHGVEAPDGVGELAERLVLLGLEVLQASSSLGHGSRAGDGCASARDDGRGARRAPRGEASARLLD